MKIMYNLGFFVAISFVKDVILVRLAYPYQTMICSSTPVTVKIIILAYLVPLRMACLTKPFEVKTYTSDAKVVQMWGKLCEKVKNG